ncbi:MAG TPA: T9SS type A sorting domain-containing protein, partial [Cyclobacteriaceae bacterium]
YNVESNECAGSATQSIMVHELPAPLMTTSTELLCSGDARILSAIPEGGSFSVLSGPGEITGDTLLANGTGEIQIQYTWNQNGCSANATQVIPAQQSPGVHFTNSQDHFCMHDTIALYANPPGGIFELLSGPGELDSNILTATSGGEILISYAITQNGCTGSAQNLFSAIDVSQLAFTMDTSVMCSGSSRTLSATPAGGIFWMIGGPGMISNSVLRSTGEGLIKIQYLINEEECYGEITQRITSKRTPTVEFETDSLSICIGEEKLIGITPDLSQLTLLSGPGMLNGHLLTSIDTGFLKVTGQLETNGCIGTDTLTISSHSIPVPEITVDNPVICIGTSIQLTGDPPGGTFTIMSGEGSFNGNVLTALDIGPIQFAYTAEEHQCAGTVYGELLVINPVADIVVADDLLTSSSSVGIFQWLDCENNFEPLPGENNDTLMVALPGSYALVNGAGTCIDTSACVVVALTSIEIGESDPQIRIFPNPVSSILFINGYDSLPVKEMSIRNALGEKVYTQRDVNSSASMDLTGCRPGLYFLEISLKNGGNYVFRVVKI